MKLQNFRESETQLIYTHNNRKLFLKFSEIWRWPGDIKCKLGCESRQKLSAVSKFNYNFCFFKMENQVFLK